MSWMSRRKVTVLLVVLLVLTNLGTYAMATGRLPWGASLVSRHALPPQFDRLARVYRLIELSFVHPDRMDPDRMVEGAISGMLRTLEDPYSYYLDPAAYEQFMAETEGEYQGIGVVVEYQDPYTTVVHPFRDSPAEKAGVWPKDRIIRVDGQDVVGMPLDVVVTLIRGPAGTPVNLTILRANPDGSERTLDLVITRARILVNPAHFTMLDPVLGIGYLHLSGFDQRTPEVAARALGELLAQGMRALVLDLRNNSGGLLDECAEVARLFVPSGKIVDVVYRDGRRESYESRTEGFGLPVVVLINGGTASAAEILAGAIRDRGVGILVGTRSFGKGSVQNLHSLGGGTALRLTTALYYLPSGATVDRVGLEPAVWVENAEPAEGEEPIRLEDAADPRNLQLAKALSMLRSQLGR